MPLLEELVETPVLRKNDLDHDTAAQLKNYGPPALMAQVEASLSAEFGRHLVRTDWSTYEDPLMQSEHEQAARLIGYTLATMGRAVGTTGGPAPPISKAKREEPSGTDDTNSVMSTKEGEEERVETGSTGVKAEAWVKRECDQLLRELETGDTSRWEAAEYLVGRRRWAKLTAAQRDALLPAINMVGRNAHLHPANKRRLLNTIIEIVIKTVS